MASTGMPGPGDDELDDEVVDDELDDELDEFDDEPADVSSSGPAEELTAFVTYMVTSLVDDPSVIEIRPEKLGANVHIKVVVPESEMGKVIGRNGRVARSMRTLLTIAAARKGVRASLDIDS